MKKLLFINLLPIIVVVSFYCKSPSKNTKNTMTNYTAHTSRTSLDWDGIYRGALPCADCEGKKQFT